MGNWRNRSRVGIAIAVVATVCLSPSSAGLLQPQTIDAGTGADATDVGASFGSKQAWAAFQQAASGANRLYVAHAQDGVFAAAQPADRGNAVTSAALAGNGTGSAVAVFTENVAGVSTLFGRRLSGGQLGPALQISAETQNVSLLKVHRVRQVAEN